MDLAYISTKGMAPRPKTLVCYICGREYGTRSLEIHIKACERKFENEQKKLPKNKRKPVPQPPKGFKNMIRLAQGKKPLPNEEMPGDDMQLQGADGDDIYAQFMGGAGSNNEAAAFGGGGTFGARGGGGFGNPGRAIQMYNENAFKNWDQNILEPCQHCHRTFRPEAMEHHRKACTAEKPLKPLNKGEDGELSPLKSKSPNLGLAARQAAAEKEGKFAETQFSPGRDKNRSSQPKQTQKKPGNYESRTQGPRINTEYSDKSHVRTASIDLRLNQQGRTHPQETHQTLDPTSLDDMYENMISNPPQGQLQVPKSRGGIRSSSKGVVGRRSPQMVEQQTQEDDAAGDAPKWKKDRDQFIKAVRLGKQINALEKDPNINNDPYIQDQIRALANQIPGQNQDMIDCPHCGRKFGKKAAERHIEKCATIQNRPKPPPTKEEVEQKRNYRMRQYGSPGRLKRSPTYDRENHLRNSTIHEAFAPDTSVDHEEFTLKDESMVVQQVRTQDYQEFGKNFDSHQNPFSSHENMGNMYHTSSFQETNQLETSGTEEMSLLRSSEPQSLQEYHQNVNKTMMVAHTQQHEVERLIDDNERIREYNPNAKSRSPMPGFSSKEAKSEKKQLPSAAERAAAYNNVECPTCGKRFSKKVALSHIPTCQEKLRDERMGTPQPSGKGTPSLSKQGSQKHTGLKSKAARGSISYKQNTTQQSMNKSPIQQTGQKLASNRSDKDQAKTPVKRHAFPKQHRTGAAPKGQPSNDSFSLAPPTDQSTYASYKTPVPPSGRYKGGPSPLKQTTKSPMTAAHNPSTIARAGYLQIHQDRLKAPADPPRGTDESVDQAVNDEMMYSDDDDNNREELDAVVVQNFNEIAGGDEDENEVENLSEVASQQEDSRKKEMISDMSSKTLDNRMRVAPKQVGMQPQPIVSQHSQKSGGHSKRASQHLIKVEDHQKQASISSNQHPREDLAVLQQKFSEGQASGDYSSDVSPTKILGGGRSLRPVHDRVKPSGFQRRPQRAGGAGGEEQLRSEGQTSTMVESKVSEQSQSTQGAVRMSKYCMDCGFKFLQDNHKFCGECGQKREVLQ